ncbi:heat shock protein 30 [Dichomitus squalens]|uniref:Heat shock protein 30 n=1 Tax=Dichomitus squalens TaxID=114155 RepID=A0A4Q9N734_9APHY|nr:heat shock protein 30 [Dichomitus squalens LYAD-421 SS1]EJF65915.1 heat shock protein 30 [Dichomitus squalens LYAD-421 SS1]TBU35917.1 heat shock protein 30 [Dichomitus squalens]TBU50842.1 heat shock protein 30 [Dichomitus squalens]TBU65764.1 heat shock protein 30 [Dichomitus squalens]
MGNSALDINPPNATYHLTTGGSDWLWAAFSIFGAALLGVVGWTFTRPRGTRLFHQVAIVVLTTGSLAYFSMASDLGATPVTVEFRGTGTRQIWYVRYINWFISFPLLLLELLLATGLSLSDIFTTLFMGIVLVVTGLVASLVPSTYKWGYYVFGVFALIYIWYILLWHGPHTTFAAGGVVRSGYRLASSYLSCLLLLYPIAWACSEGGNVISVTSEMIWYGILDVLAGPVFLLFFLWELRGVDYNAFGLQSGKYTDKSAFVGNTATTGPATTGPVTTTGAAGNV